MSQFAREAAEAAATVRRQLATCSDRIERLAERLRAHPPRFVATCARGSSDHAALYGKYVLETTVGSVVASIGPSVAGDGSATSVAHNERVASGESNDAGVASGRSHDASGESSESSDAGVASRSHDASVASGGSNAATVTPAISRDARAPIDLSGALLVAVSQSGRSPDLIRLVDAARGDGALVVGMINDETSPLAARCDITLPLCAGEERSVGATKSCLAAAAMFVQLAAAWIEDPGLRDVAVRLPDALDAAAALDWRPALLGLATTTSMFVIGRGVGLGIAAEMALKLKEVCRLHAEAFSAAEVMHGPVALVGPGFPILALGALPELELLRALGARILEPPAIDIAPIAQPLCQLQSFYLALPALAIGRGFDPDAPRNLTKVTLTH